MTAPRPVPPPVVEPRILWGWPLLLGLLILLAFVATRATFSESRNRVSLVAERQKLATMQKLPESASDRDALIRSAERLVKVNGQEADALRVALLTEAKAKVPADLLDRVRKSAPRIAAAYAPGKLDAKSAKAIADRIPASDPMADIAKRHVLTRGGVTVPLMPRAQMIGIGVFGMLALGGVALWIGYATSRANGNLRPLGHPLEPMDRPRLDRVPLRALSLFVLYSLVGLLTALGGGGLLSGVVGAVAMLMCAVVLFSLPVYGKRLNLADVGLSRANFGQNVVTGFAVWCMTLPLLLVAVAVGSALAKFLPEPIHPITQEMATAGPAALIGIFISASVIAPFWEEIFFRGLLFPGLSNLTRQGPVVGALLSSLLFAAIHPQGIALWLGLGTIGGMSCFAAHHTKSLVPSITLHAIHNTATLVLALLTTR